MEFILLSRGEQDYYLTSNISEALEHQSAASVVVLLSELRSSNRRLSGITPHELQGKIRERAIVVVIARSIRDAVSQITAFCRHLRLASDFPSIPKFIVLSSGRHKIRKEKILDQLTRFFPENYERSTQPERFLEVPNIDSNLFDFDRAPSKFEWRVIVTETILDASSRFPDAASQLLEHSKN